MAADEFETTLEDPPDPGGPPPFPPAILTEVHFEGDLSRSDRDALRVAALGAGMILLIVLLGNFVSGSTGFILILSMLFILIFLFMLVRPFHSRRWVRSMRLDLRTDSHDAVLLRVVRGVRGMGANWGLRELVRRMAESGVRNSTLRVRRRTDPDVPGPFTMPFEPQRLDETTCTLDCEAATPASSPQGAAGRSGLGPQIRRNIVLGGGWILVGAMGFIAIMSGMEAVRRGQMTFRFGFHAAILLGLLFLPRRSGLTAERQWFLVPGGLLRRRAARDREAWALHLFDRRLSVLIVGRYYRGMWAAFFADPDQCDQLMVTEREARLLLRAWLSPLPPPSPDRLADLT